MAQKEKFSVFFDNITEIKIGLDYYTDFKNVINNVLEWQEINKSIKE